MLGQLQCAATPVTIHAMEYRRIPGDDTSASRPEVDAPSISTAGELEKRIRELEGELEQRSRDFKADIENARVEAREQGRIEAGEEQTMHIETAAQQLTAAIAEFAAGRDGYLERVEQEVVRLALSIAARILHREAQMDPLLLAGAVRVALGQLSGTTEVRLIVPAREQELWSDMLRLMPRLPLRPELVADDTLSAGECRIETQLGNIDLGVRSQLAEIERGFFDLLAKREGTTVRTHEPGGATRQEQQPSGAGD